MKSSTETSYVTLAGKARQIETVSVWLALKKGVITMETEKMICRYCKFPIREEACSHLYCEKSYARGFCSMACARMWDEEKELALKKAS